MCGITIWSMDNQMSASLKLMNAEDPLFLLYTSGSSGKPKGVVHTTGGYITYAVSTFRDVFDIKEDDVYWCTADVGWITGHTYRTYDHWPMVRQLLCLKVYQNIQHGRVSVILLISMM